MRTRLALEASRQRGDCRHRVVLFSLSLLYKLAQCSRIVCVSGLDRVEELPEAKFNEKELLITNTYISIVQLVGTCFVTLVPTMTTISIFT
jgi:hypothetical protein